ncbi:MAG: chemotaxis protein CheC [SAR324 cluster bacterium]|nr:chemotaxis protein CheC [SAR324 cluster bacterium]
MEISRELKDLLTEVFHIGVGQAADALSEMLDLEIEMEVPQLHFLNFSTMEEYLRQNQGEFVCVRQEIHGDLEGMGTLSLTVDNGKTLMEQLLKITFMQPGFGLTEMEAIKEVGNIIINAVGAAFDDIIKFEINFDVPHVSQIDTAIPFQASFNEQHFFMVAQTSISIKEFCVEGVINLMFTSLRIAALEDLVRQK